MKVKVKFSDIDTQRNLSLILNEIDYFGIKSAENYTSVCEALDKLTVTKVEHGDKVKDITDYFIPNQKHAKDITYKSINITGEKEGVTKNVSFIYAGFKSQSYINNLHNFAHDLQKTGNRVICQKTLNDQIIKYLPVNQQPKFHQVI